MGHGLCPLPCDPQTVGTYFADKTESLKHSFLVLSKKYKNCCLLPILLLPTAAEHVYMVKKETPAQALGRAIRHYRSQKGMSQFDVWDKCKIDRSFLSEIENGHKNPSLNTILKIAYSLGIKAQDLFIKANL